MPTSFSLSRLRKVLAAPEVPAPGRATAATASPLYLRLAEALAQSIRSGHIAVGTRLPSERTGAEQLGVSRTTVTAAYQELTSHGLVRGHVGRGTVVIADEPDRAATVPWAQLASRLVQATAPSSAAAGAAHIGLASGWMHPSLAPHSALAACAAIAARDSALLTIAAPILGLPALREALVPTLRASGVRAAADDVLVTGGAQQGLNIVARALVSPGDTVVCESPTWHGAFRAFRAAGAEVAGVMMDREGIDPGALEDTLVRLRPKFVYLIPSFHCPTGRLMSLERRRCVLEICTRFRTPVVESHVYGDIHFGETLPPLKALDAEGIVIHLGSASKTIGAALRIGWLVAPPPALELLAAAKSSFDLSTPALPQAVLAGFLASGGYARHLPRFRSQLRTRRDALLAALAAHCPPLRCAVPEGGLYLWLQLPKPLTGLQVEAAAADEGVAVRSGEAFLPEGGPSGHLRLCFAAPAAEDIAPGAQRLGKALRALAQRHAEPLLWGPGVAAV